MTITLPKFITFTGVDDNTDVVAMHALADKYPIEWGVLFSSDRQEIDPRYPGARKVSQLLHNTEILGSKGLSLSAHFCGQYSRSIMQKGAKDRGRAIEATVDLGYFKRIQVNHPDPHPLSVALFCKGWGPRGIAQTGDRLFPPDVTVDWLFDRSGGLGKAPSYWPPHPGRDRLVGYAGGIAPYNVAEVIAAINLNPCGPYWLDMEFGVRTANLFDLAKVRAVCEAVYG